MPTLLDLVVLVKEMKERAEVWFGLVWMMVDVLVPLCHLNKLS